MEKKKLKEKKKEEKGNYEKDFKTIKQLSQKVKETLEAHYYEPFRVANKKGIYEENVIATLTSPILYILLYLMDLSLA